MVRPRATAAAASAVAAVVLLAAVFLSSAVGAQPNNGDRRYCGSTNLNAYRCHRRCRTGKDAECPPGECCLGNVGCEAWRRKKLQWDLLGGRHPLQPSLSVGIRL